LNYFLAALANKVADTISFIRKENISVAGYLPPPIE
jgi:hypothetical protein